MGRVAHGMVLERLSMATTTALAAAFGARWVNGGDATVAGKDGGAMHDPSMETISGER